MRWRRWALGALGALAVTLGAVLALLFVALRSLDRPWVKGRVQALARSAGGVDIDYASAQLALSSGILLRDLVLRSPPEMQAFAPELARAGSVAVRWSWPSLWSGRGPFVRQVTIADLALTVVADEHGRTSFDAIGPPRKPSPPVPLSHLAASFLGTAAPVERVDVNRAALTLVQIEGGAVAARTDLRGLSLALAMSAAGPAASGSRLQLDLGQASSPLALELARAPAGATPSVARANLWATFDATPAAAKAILDLQLTEQTFAQGLDVDHGVHAEAALRFDPTAAKTAITLDHTQAGDGAATAEGSLVLFDAGDPVVQSARGDIDAARLLAWLPTGMVPLSAEGARLRYAVESLVVGPVTRLLDGGSVTIDADLSKVELAGSPRPLRIGHANLALRAEPASGGDGGIRGTTTLALTHVEVGGQPAVAAENARVELRADALHPDTEHPLATRGDLSLAIDAASLDVRAATRVTVEGLALRAHAGLAGKPPYAVELDVPAARLRVSGPAGRLLADGPAHVTLKAHDVDLGADTGNASHASSASSARGAAALTADLGDVRATLDVTKEADAVGFALHLGARSLRALRPFLSPALNAEVPLDAMAAEVRSSGRVEHIGGGAPAIRQATEIDLARPAFENVAASSLALAVRSQGTAMQHHVEADLRAKALAFDAGGPSDDHLTLTATVDRLHPSLEFDATTEGRAATHAAGRVSFDPSRRALLYDLESHVAGLGPLAPFAGKIHGLDAFDLSQLEVNVSAHGALLGVVAGVTGDGAVTLAPDPARSAAVDGSTEVRVAHFHWSRGDDAVITPAVVWRGVMKREGDRRVLDSHVEVGTLHLDLGDRDVDLNGIDDEAHVSVAGSLIDPDLELRQRLAVHAVEQNVLPEYPLGDVGLTVTAERGREGVVHVSDLEASNGAGGTKLELSGNVDLGADRRALSVTTSVTQDLARLSRIPERFKGSGKASLEANVTSPDFARYHVRALVKGEGVRVAVARAGVEVDDANGEVPVTLTLAAGAGGVTLERSEKGSPYSMLRFADQHPLLSRSGFLSIARLKTPFAAIAPLVGNLEVEQNIVSLRQFEMGVRGGKITGQCGIDWNGPRSTLELHVRANGVQSSHGEPFDGNIAVAISAADRTIDGRAEILRIGERHLLDLLDLQDPLHVDPAMNRIRAAMAFGYPKNLRLVFDHGFASAHLELGGLAQFVSIGELRGIPMGPIVDRMIGPALEAPAAKETP